MNPVLLNGLKLSTALILLVSGHFASANIAAVYAPENGYQYFEVKTISNKGRCKEGNGAGVIVNNAGILRYSCSVSVFTKDELLDRNLAQLTRVPSIYNLSDEQRIVYDILRRLNVRLDIYAAQTELPNLDTGEVLLSLACNTVTLGCTKASLDSAIRLLDFTDYHFVIDIAPYRQPSGGGGSDCQDNDRCRVGLQPGQRPG